MDQIKEAFQKVKKDMDFMRQEIDSLKLTVRETREKMIEMSDYIKKINEKIINSEISDKDILKNKNTDTSTDKHIIPTNSTHPSTDTLSFKALNHQNLSISTGNQGVSTDRQTDTSTDRQTENIQQKEENTIRDAIKIIDSLDSIKKEIRIKFKRLTEQELLVFSTIYQLDEEIGHSDYKDLSARLKLTESSIRDYVGRLIKKGIPVDKKKINNKTIHLSVSQNLKKIASLPTILQLIDL